MDDVAGNSPPASLCFASKLFDDGAVTKDEYAKLQRPLAQDITAGVRCRNSDETDTVTLSLPGNITVEHIFARSCLEPVWKVVNTAELLERILCYIPTEDLVLSVPRVCKGFRDAVEGSSTLLRLSFLEPDFDSEVRLFPLLKYVKGFSANSGRTMNPESHCFWITLAK